MNERVTGELSSSDTVCSRGDLLSLVAGVIKGDASGCRRSHVGLLAKSLVLVEMLCLGEVLICLKSMSCQVSPFMVAKIKQVAESSRLIVQAISTANGTARCLNERVFKALR